MAAPSVFDRIERKMWIALCLAAANLAMSLATLACCAGSAARSSA
jgi:hypothetical protein